MSLETLVNQFQRLVVLVSTLVEAAINKLPARLSLNGQLRDINPARQVAVISVSVAGTSTYTGEFRKGDDVVIDYITAYTADSAGLNAFRISLEDEKAFQFIVNKDKPDGTLTRPRGAQILPSTSDDLSDRPSMMFFWPKEKPLNLVLENASGTPTYTVELCIHFRIVRPAQG